MGSKKYSLNKEDLKRIGVGALVATAGALLTYGTEIIAVVDFGAWTPVAVMVFSILANVVRKFLTDYEGK
jgi:uncharacterized hydantoinase/oxoprolinase family protein